MFYLLLLLFTFVSSLNPSYVIRNGSRFDKIYLPLYNYSHAGEIYGYNVFLAPISVCPLKNSLELCEKSRNDLLKHDPLLWNSSSPCQEYFCKEYPKYNSTLMHYSAHRYCLQCSTTQNENLTLSRYCKNFDLTVCQQCSSETSCIYYDERFSLCYHQERNSFLWKDDFMHLYLVPFQILVFPYFVIVFCFIFSILYLIFIIIPTISVLIKQLRSKSQTIFDKIYYIVNLQNQIKIAFFLSNVLLFLASLLDSILYFTDGSNFILVLSFIAYGVAALLIVGVISLIIYWFNMIKLMDNLSVYLNPSMRYVVLYIISFLVFGFLGFITVLFFLLYRIIDKAKRAVFIYLLGTSIILLILVILLIIIFLFVLSIRMLWILNKTKMNDDSIFEIALKLKVKIFSIP